MPSRLLNISLGLSLVLSMLGTGVPLSAAAPAGPLASPAPVTSAPTPTPTPTPPASTPTPTPTMTPAPPRPDLVISEKSETWVDQAARTYRVSYTVRNAGNWTAPAGHDVGLTVDNATLEQKAVPVSLAPGATYSDNFTSVATLSGTSDTITLRTDANREVDERDPYNNQRTNTWWAPGTALGGISGHVYRSGGVPVEGGVVSVIKFTTPVQVYGEVTTNADGTYRVGGLPAGQYAVHAGAAGWAGFWYNGAYGTNESVPVSVNGTADTPNIDFTFTEPGAAITGRVYGTGGTVPVERALVIAFAYSSITTRLNGFWATQTGPDGTYRLLGLPGGQYALRAGAPGYATEWYGDAYSVLKAAPVTIAPPADTANINFTLDPGGTISGTIRNASGSAALGSVSVEARRTVDYGPTDWFSATADSSGSYTIPGLPYGDYRVRAPGGGRWGPNDDNLITEYYSNKTNEKEANPVNVSSGVNPAAIDFTLDVGGSVSGRVLRSDNVTPIANCAVSATDNATRMWVSGANTDSQGYYTLRGLPPGATLVRAQPLNSGLNYVAKWYNNVLSMSEATPVPVAAQSDTPGINFSLEPGGSITGRVYRADGVTPFPDAMVYASPLSPGYGMPAASAPDGSYTIRGLAAGQYRVYAWASGYITEYYNNAYQYDTATPVTVTPSSDTGNINFTMELGGTISGRVLRSDNVTPIGGIQVSAVRLDTKDSFYTKSDSLGNYSIPALFTGQYLVYASGQGYIREYYNNAPSSTSATPVSVTAPGNTPNINFTLEPGGTISGRVFLADGVTPVTDAYVYAYAPQPAPTPPPVPKPSPTPPSAVPSLAAPSEPQADGPPGAPGPVDIPMENADGTPVYGGKVAPRTATRSLDGSYTITGLPTGSYRVYASAPGFIREYYNNVHFSTEATSVNVTAPNETPGINFSLDVGGTISGRVFRSDNVTPIAGASVTAEMSPTVDYSAGATSAGDGTYTVRGLPGGTYKVRASGAGYLPEYYNNVSGRDAATLVTVTPPNNTPDIVFTLDLGGTISGRVLRSDNVTPVTNATVYAYQLPPTPTPVTPTPVPAPPPAIPAPGAVPSPTPPPGMPRDGTPAGRPLTDLAAQSTEAAPLYRGQVAPRTGTRSLDGSYTIVGLPTGSYRVYADAPGFIREYYNNVYSSGQATSVNVTATNTTPDINFSLDVGGTISGRVIAADNVTPIAGAFVYALPVSVGGYRSATSASDGSYTLAGLTPGQYRLYARAAGYLREYYNNVYQYENATVLAVAPASDIRNIVFTLDLGGTISGRVYTADGATPLAAISVTAYRLDTGEGFGASTDSLGSYSISGLPTSQYRVYASGQGYLREYYNNVADSALATPVGVTAPGNTANINFTLDLGATISGRVFLADGVTPVTDAYVYAYALSPTIPPTPPTPPLPSAVPSPAPPPGVPLDGTATVQPEAGPAAGTAEGAPLYRAEVAPRSASRSLDGSYTIAGLPTGSYRVYAVAPGFIWEYYNNVHFSSEATSVNVTAPRNTPDINFTLDVGGTISGRVLKSDNVTPISGALVYAAGSAIPSSSSATAASDGTYTVTGLPGGAYRVYATAAGYLGEYYDNVPDSHNATLVNVTTSNNTPDINFTLDLGGTISGRVFRSDNVTPISGAWVSAESSAVPYVEGATTASDGTYTVTGLPGGAYRVYASAAGYLREYYNNVSDYASATPVSVTASSNTPDINFTLDMGGTISGRVFRSDSVTPVTNASVHAYPATGPYPVPALTQGAPPPDTREAGEGFGARLVTPVTPAQPPPPAGPPRTDAADSAPAAPVYSARVASAGSRSYDGSYTITGLPSGWYVVYASAPGYITEYYTNVHRSRDATPVSVTAPGETTNINFNLDVGGTIAGRVVRSDNVTPIAGATLSAYSPFLGSSRSANSAYDGSYSITGLPAGQHRVRASADGYVSEYYDNTLDDRRATLVTVTESGITPNIVFALDQAGTISGRVFSSDNGTPVAGASLTADLLGTGYSYPGWASSAADGTYTIGRLPTGQYRVQVYATGYIHEFYSNAYFYDEATSVNVTAPGNTPDINFALETGGTISGRVLRSDNVTPIAGAWVNASHLTKPFGGASANTASDGTYSVTGLPGGPYRVWASAAGYIREYYNNTSDYNNATSVNVTASGNTPDINFTLDAGGSISGRVTYLRAGVPAPVAGVYLYATDNRTGEWYGYASSDSQGNYTITGLRTGGYRVRAYPSGSSLPFVDEYYDNTHMWGAATVVPVTTPANTPGIDFVLEPLVVRPTVQAAITDGVAWLAAQQKPDGSWGNAMPLLKTGLAVHKLSSLAREQGMTPFAPTFPYRDNVTAGLNYIFSRASVASINPQMAGNPDSNGNQAGVFFTQPNGTSVDTSVALLAIAATGEPARVVNVPGSAVNGRTYGQVAQDTADYLAWAQTDAGPGRGGWSYMPLNNAAGTSDQLNSAWPILALAAAQSPVPAGLGMAVPGFVRTELNYWIDYVQNDSSGGSGNTAPGDYVSAVWTAALLNQMAFVGDTADTGRVKAALDYLALHWGESYDPGWRGQPTDYYTTYTMMKGLEALRVDAIGPINWFRDFTQELLGEQSATGWWPLSRVDDGELILSTELALLTLEHEAPAQGPDLIVREQHAEWVNETAGTYRVIFSIKNTGNADIVPGHDVSLTVDGVVVQQKQVPITLPPLAVFSDSFATVTMDGPSDNITVTADFNREVPEVDEGNNSLSSVWSRTQQPQPGPSGARRVLPASVMRSQTFAVTVTFTAPGDSFNAIGLSDFAPAGWTVTVDRLWSTPQADTSRATSNRADYIWYGPYARGAAFTAVYQVTVPAGTPLGVYTFSGGRLEYYLGGSGPTVESVTGNFQVEVAEGARISGHTYEARGVALPGVTLTMDNTTSVVSDGNGGYQLMASSTGTHTIVATKPGHRSQTRTVNVTDLAATYTVNFKGMYALVPNSVDMSYVLACINKWKFPPEAEVELDISKVLAVINAWKFPL